MILLQGDCSTPTLNLTRMITVGMPILTPRTMLQQQPAHIQVALIARTVQRSVATTTGHTVAGTLLPECWF